ncbi:thiamine diphosphate-binding protein [Lipomyces mesembrius]
MAPPIGFVRLAKTLSAARVAYLFSETVLSVQPNLKAAPVVGFQHALDRMVYDKVRGIVAKRGTVPSLSKFPVVVHVSMSRYFADFSEITCVRQLEFTLIQSFSLREAQDLAIASHVLAIRTGKGVIHFFHQPEGEETSIPIEDVNQIYKIFDRNALVYGGTEGSTVANKVYWNDTAVVAAEKRAMKEAAKENTNVEQVNDNVDLSKVDYKTAGMFQAAEAIFDLMRVAIGRTYKPFDYHGAANADTALLILGTSAQNFITTIGHAGWGDIYSKVGVITVRVYRPWSAEKLLAVIPRSIKRLGVLEQVHRQTTKWGPVLLDVITSLNNGLSIAAAIPVVVGYQLGYLDSKTVRQALRGIVQKIQSELLFRICWLPELETAYSKMLYNVFGDKLSILNALDMDDTGIPRTITSNPEYGFGAYLAKEEKKKELVSKLLKAINENGFTDQETNDLVLRWLLLSSENSSKLSEVGAEVISKLESDSSKIASELLYYDKAFFLGTSSWIIGSDAWSYDLGTSGVHNVIASGKNVNVLIIDSQPYTGRAAKDASRRKKDIGLYAMNYSNSYVASIAVYSSYTQALQAFIEADKFTGPSIIIAYLPYNEETDSALTVLQETKKAVDSSYWPLYRWDPRLDEGGLPTFQLDSQVLKKELKDFLEPSSVTRQKTPILSFLRDWSAVDHFIRVRWGNAENLAKRFQRRAKGRGLGAVVMAMDTFPIEKRGAEWNLVIVTSTAGQGEFPQNGRNFWEAVKSSTDLDLTSVNYSVFGLGDSHYWPRKQDRIYYNKLSKDLNQRLEILGAKRMVELGLDSVPIWETELWKALGVHGSNAAVDDPPPWTNEDIKMQSNYLRGTIVEGLNDESTGAISASDSQVAKFHGAYLQDDRDVRTNEGQIADDKGNRTVKITTRGTYQLHGVIKKKLRV